MLKYEITDITREIAPRAYENQNSVSLRRIRALKNFHCNERDVKKGDLGGWIEKESNLTQEGTAWLFDDACAYGDSVVSQHASLHDSARICDQAQLTDHAAAYKQSAIFQNAYVSAQTIISDESEISGNAVIGDFGGKNSAVVMGCSTIDDHAVIDGDADITDSFITKSARIGKCHVIYDSTIGGSAVIDADNNEELNIWNADICSGAVIRKPSDYLVVGPLFKYDLFCTFFRSKYCERCVHDKYVVRVSWSGQRSYTEHNVFERDDEDCAVATEKQKQNFLELFEIVKKLIDCKKERK